MLNEYEILERAWRYTVEQWAREYKFLEKHLDDEVAKERVQKLDADLTQLAAIMHEIKEAEA